MGFLSNLFGGNKEDKALREAMAHIHRILDDEAFQLELVHPTMKAMLQSAPAYDKDPTGVFVQTQSSVWPAHPVPPPRSHRHRGRIRSRVIQWS